MKRVDFRLESIFNKLDELGLILSSQTGGHFFNFIDSAYIDLNDSVYSIILSNEDPISFLDFDEFLDVFKLTEESLGINFFF